MLSTTGSAQQPGRPNAVNPAGTVRAGDLIEVVVWGLVVDATPATMQVRVDADGKAALPLLNAIPVAGQTTDVAAVTFAQAYRQAAIEPAAIITVGIVEPADRATVKPGVFASGETARILLFDLGSEGRPAVVNAVVAENGTVQIPLVGAVTLRGLTEADAAIAIQQAFRTRRLADNALVSVLRTSMADPAPAAVPAN
jgi:protein involved in polysaccharide export with SLBB domain